MLDVASQFRLVFGVQPKEHVFETSPYMNSRYLPCHTLVQLPNLKVPVGSFGTGGSLQIPKSPKLDEV